MSEQKPEKYPLVLIANSDSEAISNPKINPKKSSKWLNQLGSIVNKFQKILIIALVFSLIIIGSGVTYILTTQGSDSNSYIHKPKFNLANKLFQDLGDAISGQTVVTDQPKSTPIESELDDSAIINTLQTQPNPDISDSDRRIQPITTQSSSQSVSLTVSSSSSQSSLDNSEPIINSSSSSLGVISSISSVSASFNSISSSNSSSQP